MGTFGTWLQGELDKRGWDQRQAATACDVAETSMHNWLFEDIKPNPKNVLKLARGLQLPPEDVMRYAGYDPGDYARLPPDEQAKRRAEILAAIPQFAEIIDLVAKKPPERQAAYLEMIRRILIDPSPPD